MAKTYKASLLSVYDENGNKIPMPAIRGDKPVKGVDYFTEQDKAEIIAAVLDGIGTPVFGTVDENNNIILSGTLPDGTYSIKYEMEEGDTINIGNLVIDTNTYYSVTNNLTNCTNSNSANEAAEGGSYSAIITANSGYELKSVAVTMGGNAVSVSGGVINIASVTGAIVITAVAEEVQTGPTNLADPTSADWQEGYRLSISSGEASECEGHTVTNFIPAKMGDVLRVKGLSIVGNVNSQDAKIVGYNSSKTKINGLYGSTATGSSNYGNKVTTNGDISTITVLMSNTDTQTATSAYAYIRIDGILMDGYTKNDVIITINEEIA